MIEQKQNGRKRAVKANADYSLYLVTDNTKAILGDRDFLEVVRSAIKGGVTIVQLRDKTGETADLINTAKALHDITQEYEIPLIINDRADVALACGAEGLHIGQDDMDLTTARELLGSDAIIGVTVSTKEEALEAAKGGADYLGIGTVYATPTKENTKSIIGISGVRSILSALSSSSRNPNIPTVMIGGLNGSNIQRVLYQTCIPNKTVDGVAIVSAIMASPDPESASSTLLKLFKTPPPFHISGQLGQMGISDPRKLVREIPGRLRSVAFQKPLCHNITNTVVQNLAANVALAVGGSPIMSQNGHEAPDLAALGGSLVLNMGTVTSDALHHYTLAIRAYNATGRPILLDPVGGGATVARRSAVKTLLDIGYFSIIKGNEAEISTVLGTRTDIRQRGVDSATSSSSGMEKALMTRELAKREHCVVLMTGAIDYLSDSNHTYAISNGHEYLGLITGSGCTLGTTLAAFSAVEGEDLLLAVLAGTVVFELAAERAARREDVKGPGTFVPAFLDELFTLRRMAENGEDEWIEGAKVEYVKL